MEGIASTRAGSFASVVRVKELGSGKTFAAKVPHFKASDPASRSRKNWEALEEEFKKVINLRHPHIVTAIEILPSRLKNEPPWLIMEWIQDDLSSIDLNVRDLPSLASQLTGALQYLHSQNYAHRDVKPDNILIQLYCGRLVASKLADFGTSKLDASGRMDTYAGTSIYMAPEFWQENLYYTKAIDMWSLGVVLAQGLSKLGASLRVWDSRIPPSKNIHEKWIKDSLLPLIDLVPKPFAPLLVGLLSESVQSRWTALDSHTWLREHFTELSIDEESDNKKRPASLTDLEDLERGRSLPRALRSETASSPSPTDTIEDPYMWGSGSPKLV
ncbi:hypothetical protein LTR86_010991 [Recurvomyces mirabilis]|nr:hypothetical protein LTR86_010991 [Recurvomyces mirabilis]